MANVLDEANGLITTGCGILGAGLEIDFAITKKRSPWRVYLSVPFPCDMISILLEREIKSGWCRLVIIPTWRLLLVDGRQVSLTTLLLLAAVDPAVGNEIVTPQLQIWTLISHSALSDLDQSALARPLEILDGSDPV